MPAAPGKHRMVVAVVDLEIEERRRNGVRRGQVRYSAARSVLAATAAGSSAQSITRTDWILRVLAPNHRCRGSHAASAVSSTARPCPATKPDQPLVSRSSTANSSRRVLRGRLERQFREFFLPYAGGLEFEPEEGIGSDAERIRRFGDGRERNVAQHLHRLHAGESRQVERDGLREAAQVGDAEDGLVGSVAAVKVAQVGEDLAVRRIEERQRAAPEHLEQLAQRDHVARPVQQRRLIALLRLHVDRLVAPDRVHDHREIEPAPDRAARSRRCGPRSTASACARRCGRRDRCCRPCRSRRRNR